MMGDAEKVLTLIDAYDRMMSDNSNDIESFANAYMVFENVQMDAAEWGKAQSSGAFAFRTGADKGSVYYLTKNISDTFTENNLTRTQANIYRLSQTPNLSDVSFGSASGVSLRYKIIGLEAKCGMFQTKMQGAGMYMFELLGALWNKKHIPFSPLQATMEFTRNLPVDLAGEADYVQKLIGMGIPKQVAYSQLSFVDDVDYIMGLVEAEKDGIPDLDEDEYEPVNDTGVDDNVTDN